MTRCVLLHTHTTKGPNRRDLKAIVSPSRVRQSIIAYDAIAGTKCSYDPRGQAVKHTSEMGESLWPRWWSWGHGREWYGNSIEWRSAPAANSSASDYSKDAHGTFPWEIREYWNSMKYKNHAPFSLPSSRENLPLRIYFRATRSPRWEIELINSSIIITAARGRGSSRVKESSSGRRLW